MTYEDPLAYAIGLQGAALLRAFTGEHDRAFTRARVDAVRRLLDEPALQDAGVEVARLDPVEAYGIWAPTYDAPNPAFDFDEALIREVAGARPAGVALDAACGTGRVAALLGNLGHEVVGVDASPEMLALARRRVPRGTFWRGTLQGFPVDDASVDLVTCSLALTHVPQLEPVLREMARVLRPGGSAVIADVHPEVVARGAVPAVRREDGTPGRVASYRHRTGDYLRAALAAGFEVRRCEEPLNAIAAGPDPEPGPPVAKGDPGPWDTWPWSLAALAPEAARAATEGVPSMILWELGMPGR
ncbi:Demethylmenaquinone methyltransferase [Streptomyces sp. YIM 130001]|uniref:class I SAM-dependent methyltransferase n=1 Tax=Streptomyces sp. YIM 130001 TaxID=2259644 RepID=UPI000E65CBEA|nr:class I SAM-dependent methyltransferase [Streptomyces sp. YIM 130001]RII14687.1 Demethylmenaquinone methyltransferase [Streptomyces sp. YIM 130001]